MKFGKLQSELIFQKALYKYHIRECCYFEILKSIFFQALNAEASEWSDLAKITTFISSIIGISHTFVEACCYCILFRYLWNHDKEMATYLGYSISEPRVGCQRITSLIIFNEIIRHGLLAFKLNCKYWSQIKYFGSTIFGSPRIPILHGNKLLKPQTTLDFCNMLCFDTNVLLNHLTISKVLD